MEIVADESPEQNEYEETIRQMHRDAQEILSGRPKRFPEITEKRQADTLDLTPSWRTVADIILMALEHGTDKAKKDATLMLYDMAKVADDFVAASKEGRIIKEVDQSIFSKRGIEEG
jgi:hypothetical protein